MPRTRISMLATFALLAALLIVNLIVPSRDPALGDWPGGGVDDDESGAASLSDRALRVAIESQDLAGVRRAIDRGAGVNRHDFQHWSPLTHAASVGNVAVCAELLAHGAAPDGDERNGDERDNDGDSPRFPPIICAATRGHLDVIELLVRHGADLDARSPNGATALNIAASLNMHDVAVALIRGGADVNRADAHGWTPLMAVAAHADGGPLIEALLAAGARVDATDDVGDTAVNIATRGGNDQTVRLLLHRRPAAARAASRPNHLLGFGSSAPARRGPC